MGNALDVFRGLEPSLQATTVTFPYGFDGVFNRLYANEIDYGALVPPPSAALPFAYAKSTAQTISDSTPTLINTFATITNTDATAFTIATNGILLLKAGIYSIIASINFNAGDPTSIRRIDLMLNSSTVIQSNTNQQLPGATTPTQVQVTWCASFAANSNIGIQGYQNSGSVVPTSGINLQILKVG
jgi:hypothetical protein